MLLYSYNYINLTNIDESKTKIIVKNKPFKKSWSYQSHKKHLINKSISIILLVLLIILYILTEFHNFPKRKGNYNELLNQKYDSRDIAFNKSINFIKKCLTPDIIKYQYDFIGKEINVSIVIPLYNCEKYIIRAIKSIQYQNMTDIEIILVDDFSKDNTVLLTEKIQREDNRIKIIKNQKNMGVLYSRSIGVLSSKGKWLFTLDNDDLFLNDDILDSIVKIGEKGDFDIIEFKAISNKILSDNILKNKIKDSIFSHQKPFILFQPELGNYPIPVGNETGSYGLRDIFLWGKCIKTNIYQKSLNKVGYYRYSRFMIRYEDIIVNYMIFNIANSFIFIEKYGIYHIIRYGSGAGIGKIKVSRNINILYLLDIVIDFAQNNVNNKKLASHLGIYYFKLRKMKQSLTSNRYYIELFISCIKRILKSDYISETHKNQIKKLIKQLNLI